MDLKPLFEPRTVAVIGASDDFSKLGYHVMKSLTSQRFKGRMFPVNPNRDEVMGLRSYSGVDKIPEAIDLAIVVVPSRLVLQVFEDCLSKGVKSFVLITAGFKETEGAEGKILHERLKEMVKDKVPVVGPNTFGIVSYHSSLNASFTPEFSFARPGKAAIVSQSGGISHLMGFMAQELGLGLSYVVGLGNRLNLDFDKMVKYLSADPKTSVAGLYVEGIEDPKALMAEIQRAAQSLPVIVMKAGKGEVGDRASLSHTGSLAGNYEAFKSAMVQAGAMVVEDTESFIDLLKAYEVLRPPSGNRLAVLSGQAGPGMVACDSAMTLGLRVETFGSKTLEDIKAILPPMAIRSNPVDLGPLWYDENATSEIVKKVMEDPEIDAIIFLMMFASANVRSIPGLIKGLRDKPLQKPIFACIRAPGQIWKEEIQEAEREGLLCNFPTPERATKACYNMIRLEQRRLRTKGGEIGTHR